MPSAGFSIRVATAGDASGIAAIYNQAVHETTATFDLVPRTVDEQRDWITERSGAYCVVVATATEAAAPDRTTGSEPGVESSITGSERLIGFASLSPYKPRAAYSTTVEDSVYVSTEWTGRGVGRLLLADVVDRARSAGFHTVIARIEASSDASRGLHAACGFELVGVERQVGRKFGRWLDVAVMQQLL